MVAAGVVMVVTGCSAQGSVEASGAKGSASASASASPSASPSASASSSVSPSSDQPLSARQLKSLLLREGDVPGVESMTVQGPVPAYDPRVVVPGRGCQGVFDAIVTHHASTSVIQDFWWRNNRWGGRTWLASYAGAGAPEEFQKLRDGLKTCKKLVGRTPEGKLDSRVTVSKAPDLGDEAVAFDLSMDGPDGTVLTDHHIWVRVGALIAGFGDRGAQRTPGFPLDVVVDKQLDRLNPGARG